jgi:glycosyltransferase involved in cell wall biosynthesis
LAVSVPREAVHDGPVRRAAADVLRRSAPDVVVVEYLGMSPIRKAGVAGEARWLLTCHNVLSRMADQQARAMGGRRHAWLFGRDARKARRFEHWAVSAFDRVIAVSDEDAAALGMGAVDVLPNGVDVGKFEVTPLPTEPRLVFTGALYTSPNQDGIHWFCHEVLPLVRRAVTDVSLEIVGANPPPNVLALGALPGVEVHTDVPSVQPYLAKARVAIVPLRIGSGTRLKALEALAAGRPVVGTATGLEGLGLEDGSHALVANDATSFAAATVRLLRDGFLASSLVTEGRAMVEAHYSWEQIGNRFQTIVLGLAGRERNAKPD